jgi:hypothetical protein
MDFGDLMAMGKESLDQWLDAYGRAWITRNPDAAASLYAEDATYQVTPFDEPLCGRAAIHEYWKGIARTQERIKFDFEILAVTSEYGIARWWASFIIVPQGLETKLDGIFLISFDSSGLCRSLREWWQKRQCQRETISPPSATPPTSRDLASSFPAPMLLPQPAALPPVARPAHRMGHNGPQSAAALFPALPATYSPTSLAFGDAYWTGSIPSCRGRQRVFGRAPTIRVPPKT